MSNKRAGFTLAEVLVSALILSITVFWILRLANNNSAQVWVIERNRLLNETIFNTRECLKSLDFDSLNALTNTVSVNFWIDNNWCQTWSYNSSLSFSWISFKSWTGSRWEEIWSYVKIGSWTNTLTVENSVSDWTNTKKTTYKIYR
ncbi:MAG: hypothetical protein ACD_2C00264G0016 [uncultured bacterium (gcode 4)]|uniref:Prepilin-type N-terminal cleavage/methylation domain-containing protein n=1 Tax=uncultured bacterium (gcode 4) TaxID=1234023 RepID=K2FCU7_9BACT|nr:MAG: hypothetical protein ACD_2C00264G0016 [uncultured bacterium (gcode 4)]